MRALHVEALGGLDALRLTDIPTPDPGPGQVRLAIHAAGVNFADKLMLSGTYQETPEPPFVPGMECAGTVVELGPGVESVGRGEAVFAVVRHGAFAEEVVVDAQAVFRIPSRMTMREAAAFPIAYGTAQLGLRHRADLREGEVLLVNGAGGGVGLTAVEVGKALGATVIAAAGDAEKLALAESRGADHLVNYRTESLRERVAEIAGGVDVVFDPVGGAAFREALRCVNFEARLLIVGFASGEIPKIPANILLVKNVSAVGLYWGAYARQDPAQHRESFRELAALFGAGRLRPHVGAVFPLEEGAEALRLLVERRAQGKVVISVRDSR